MSFRMFQYVSDCLCVGERERRSACLCLCAWEGFTPSESAEWEQLLLLGTCRQIAMAASYQCTSHSKNTLQMTSFCAPTIAPFLQPSALLHLQCKMNLLPAQQSSALPLQLNVAVRTVSGRPGSCNAVLFCSLKLHYCAQAAAGWKQEHGGILCLFF